MLKLEILYFVLLSCCLHFVWPEHSPWHLKWHSKSTGAFCAHVIYPTKHAVQILNPCIKKFMHEISMWHFASRIATRKSDLEQRNWCILFGNFLCNYSIFQVNLHISLYMYWKMTLSCWEFVQSMCCSDWLQEYSSIKHKSDGWPKELWSKHPLCPQFGSNGGVMRHIGWMSTISCVLILWRSQIFSNPINRGC